MKSGGRRGRKRKMAPRGKGFSPSDFTTAGPVTVLHADGTTDTHLPYSAAELRRIESDANLRKGVTRRSKKPRLSKLDRHNRMPSASTGDSVAGPGV